jgi:hypothetical protein
MSATLRRLLGVLHLLALVVILVVVKPDLARDWPALLAGALVGAFPFVVGLAWIRRRGRRLGRV